MKNVAAKLGQIVYAGMVYTKKYIWDVEVSPCSKLYALFEKNSIYDSIGLKFSLLMAFCLVLVAIFLKFLFWGKWIHLFEKIYIYSRYVLLNILADMPK